MPGIPKAEVKSRIILTPEHAKRLLMALGENLGKFETVHGHVKVDDRGPGFGPLGPLGYN
jgi:predicted class III extradiol MEMO1 family dioxygenase